MATQFMSPVPWRCGSRPLVRFGEWGRHRRWRAEVFDLGSQPRDSASFRTISSQHDFLRSRAMVDLLSTIKQSCQSKGALKAISGAEEMFPRPSSVAFKQELVNTVHLIGKLEDDVKVRMLAGRQAVANVCLAVQKSVNEREPPSWFDLLFWGSFAMLAGQHLKKGDLVHVTGKVTVDTFRKERTVRVFVLDLKFVHGSQNSRAAMAHRPSAGTKSPLSRHSESEHVKTKDVGDPHRIAYNAHLRLINKNVEKEQLKRKLDHPKLEQRFLKLSPEVVTLNIMTDAIEREVLMDSRSKQTSLAIRWKI